MTLFIGPIGDLGGPAIKNKLLMKYIKSSFDIIICNTNNRRLYNLIKSVLILVFSKEQQIIVAVSKKGRLVLYPILWLKKIMNSKLKYSTICIGGTIVEDSIKYPFRIGNALKKADLVSVETHMLKAKVENKLHLKNVHYMPNYKEIITNDEDILPKKYNEDLKFVFLSSIRNVKGVGTMINAFKEVLKEYPDASLDLYGPIREDFDVKILENIKHVKNIDYKGVVNNNEVVETLKNYDVFVFPTEYTGEGFPAVLIEAFLSGLVVIASDMNYNKEIVKDAINGWVFPSGNKDELKQTIKKCFNNIDKLNIISERNVQESYKFDAETVINRFCNDLKRLGWKQ